MSTLRRARRDEHDDSEHDVASVQVRIAEERRDAEEDEYVFATSKVGRVEDQPLVAASTTRRRRRRRQRDSDVREDPRHPRGEGARPATATRHANGSRKNSRRFCRLGLARPDGTGGQREEGGGRPRELAREALHGVAAEQPPESADADREHHVEGQQPAELPAVGGRDVEAVFAAEVQRQPERGGDEEERRHEPRRASKGAAAASARREAEKMPARRRGRPRVTRPPRESGRGVPDRGEQGEPREEDPAAAPRTRNRAVPRTAAGEQAATNHEGPP